MQMWHLSGVSWDSSFHEHLRGRKVKKGLVLGGDGRLWQAVERRKRRRGREIVPGWGRLRKEGIRSNASISPVTEMPQLATHPSSLYFLHQTTGIPVKGEVKILSRRSTCYYFASQEYSLPASTSTKYNIAPTKENIWPPGLFSHLCLKISQKWGCCRYI